jgi:hypothetical protein
MAADKRFGPWQETQSAIWARLMKQGGAELRKLFLHAKVVELARLKAAKVKNAADVAIETVLMLPEFLPPGGWESRPEGPAAAAKGQLAAKDLLIEGAGTNKLPGVDADWVYDQVSAARGLGGEIRWNRVIGPAPSRGAIDLLELAIGQPDKFHAMYAKKTSGEDDGMVQRERKREGELLKRLDEIDAEVAAATGEPAHA